MKSFFTPLAASIFFAAVAPAQSTYFPIDLGILPSPSQPYVLSDNLLIGGASALPDNTEHAAFWHSTGIEARHRQTWAREDRTA